MRLYFFSIQKENIVTKYQADLIIILFAKRKKTIKRQLIEDFSNLQILIYKLYINRKTFYKFSSPKKN